MRGQTLELWDSKPWHQMKYKGRAILQTPVDLWLFEDLIQSLRPGMVVECGVYQAGFSFWLRDCLDRHELHDSIWMGIDIEKKERYWGEQMTFRNGDTIAEVHYVKGFIGERDRPLLFILDDDHSPEHVVAELSRYSELMETGDWIVACDTVPVDGLEDAVRGWVSERSDFEHVVHDKFGLSNHRGGWIRKVA